VAYARIQFRQADKERLLQLGTRTTIAGLVLLAIAISAATFVVTQVLYANTYAALVAGLLAVLLAGLWFVVPLVARLRPPEHTPAPDSSSA
jgi:Flp pilus assembly protein TadB